MKIYNTRVVTWTADCHRCDFSKCRSTRRKLNSWHSRNFYGRIKNTFRTSFPFETRWTKTYGVAGTGGGIRRKGGPTRKGWLRRSTSGTKTRDYECLSGTYVDPPGADPLDGAPDIRHRKPREIVPQVSADASIKTRWCYYSGAPLSIIFVLLLPSLSSRYSSSSSRVPGERVLVSTVYLVSRQQQRRRWCGVLSAHRARPFLFLSARAARTSARPKFRITLSLSLSTYSLPSSGQPFNGLNQSYIPEKWLRPCSRYGKQLPARIIYG